MKAHRVEQLADVYSGAIRILRHRDSLPFADDDAPKGAHREYPPIAALMIAAQKELVAIGIPAEDAALILKDQDKALFENWGALVTGHYKLTVVGSNSCVASGSETALILAGASLAGARSIISIDISDLIISLTIRAAAKSISIPHLEYRGDWWRERTDHDLER